MLDGPDAAAAVNMQAGSEAVAVRRGASGQWGSVDELDSH
jgi:hypothetical protein